MDNYFQGTFGKYMGFIKDKISPFNNNSYKLIETQNKLIYFSSFNLEIKEFEIVYDFVKKIKEHLFRKLLDATKFIVKEDIMKFTNEIINNEKKRVLVVFSVCFLHYYSIFYYNKCPSFDIFFTQNLINLFSLYQIKIINLNQFKVYCYSFYYQMINELNQFDYNLIIKLYENAANQFFTDKFIKNIKEQVTNKIFTPLISAKEKIVDMVYNLSGFMYDNKNNNPNLNVNVNFNQNLMLKNNLCDIYTKNEDRINRNNNESSSSSDNENINVETSSNEINNQIFSKRLFCELIKENIDSNTNQIINSILDNLNLSFFKDKLEKKNYSDIEFINPFLCYIIEVNSQELINQIKIDIPKDYKFRFIFTAKNIYIKAIEIYFSLYDLAGTNMNTFIPIIRASFMFHKYNQDFENNILYFFKMITGEISKSKENKNKLFLNLFLKMQVDWKKQIDEKCKNLTTFYSS